MAKKKQYFQKEFISFFKELSKNNNREWFHANKKDYEKFVKEPFKVLVDDLLNATDNAELDAKNSIFRINRDIRFSKDKTPYKTHLAAIISKGGRKDMQFPGLYLHLELGNIMLAGGCYMPDKENLIKIRRHLVENYKSAQSILNKKTFKEMFGTSVQDGEKNKILPKEFKPFAESHPLVFNKQYFFTASYGDNSILTSEELLPFILKHGKVGKDWNQFIKEAITS